MQYGWTGKILRIDLTEGKMSLDATSKYARDFIGGRGIAAKILYDECPPEVKSLDPKDLLIFSTAPLSGTSIPGGGRVAITCKSPLSIPEGLKCETGFGGFWGPELKFAGYDHLIISGRASHPVYIAIDNDDVEIRDAKNLWGKDAFETAQRIKEDFDIDSRVVTIGQAGENLVRFASILGGEQYSTSGRGGAGAVMGSKQLKGIAVRGTGEVKVAHPKPVLEITKKWHDLIKTMPNYEEFKQWGSWRDHMVNTLHYCASGNYEAEDFLQMKEMKMDEFRKSYLSKMAGCMGCPRPCFVYMRVPGSSPGGIACSSIGSFSHFVWNDDIHTLWEAATLCNTYCIDVLETAGSIAFMMELYRKGILSAKDTGGIPFERGSKEAIIDAIHRIARRESYGDILADGIPRAAEKIGRGAMAYAIHTKGLFPHGYKFQAFKGHALLMGVGHKGGDPFPIDSGLRLEFRFDDPVVNSNARKLSKQRYGTEEAYDPSQYSEAKVLAVIDAEHIERGPDILGTCTRHVPSPVPESLALEAFHAVTGVELKQQDLVRVEEKLVHLERAFDVREGIRREDDTLPRRFFTQEIESGVHKGAVIDEKKYEKMKDIYYQKRGWDIKTGIPLPETLKHFGLDGVAADLQNLGVYEKA